MSPFEVFVRQSPKSHADYVHFLAGVAIRFDAKEKSPSIAGTETFLPHNAKSYFLKEIVTLSADTQHQIIARILNNWMLGYETQTEALVLEYFAFAPPIKVSIEGTAFVLKNDNYGSMMLLRAISSCGLVSILNAFLEFSKIDLNLSDSNDKLEKHVSVFSLLVSSQISQSNTDSLQYLNVLIKENVDKEIPANKDALFHLFLLPQYAEILTQHGYSLYDTSSNIYRKVNISQPHYSLKLILDAALNPDSQDSQDLLNELLKEKEKTKASKYYQPFFDNRMIRSYLNAFLKSISAKYKDTRTKVESEKLVDFFEAYLGETWLWKGAKKQEFRLIENLKVSGFKNLYDRVLTKTSLKTLVGLARHTNDIYLICLHRNISPYDILMETDDVRVKILITEAISE